VGGEDPAISIEDVDSATCNHSIVADSRVCNKTFKPTSSSRDYILQAEFVKNAYDDLPTAFENASHIVHVVYYHMLHAYTAPLVYYRYRA
jgi:hypothetical protein